MQAISDNATVNVWLIKNRTDQPRFTTGNVRHRVIKVRCKGNTCAETGFSFGERGVGMTRRNHDTRGCQLAYHFWPGHFRRQRYFGDHVRVGAHEIDQLGVRLAHVIRVMRAFLDDVQPRTFKVQTQRLMRIFRQVFTHHADTLLH
ncbi:hypothetical protein D3C71_1031330 [compost metagenome]